MEQRTFYKETILGDKFTPCGLAIKLGASCLLESSSLSGGHSRYSMLLIDEAFRIIQEADKVYRVLPATHAQPSQREQINHKDEDILDILERLGNYHNNVTEEFPIPVGGFGYLAFEFAQYCDTVSIPKREDPLGLPLAEFLFGHIMLIFDHYTDEIAIIGVNYPGFEIDLEVAVQKTKDQIQDFNFNYLAESETHAKGILLTDATEEEQYTHMVKQVREEIIKGNLLQAVPSRRLAVQTDISAMAAYRNLRSSNPSPYQFYIDFGSYQLLGTSPEVHVKVQNKEVTIRPIAGTRRRGRNEKEDRLLEQELLADPKERAEHLMLIDLARNDLGRVCTTGSIEVTECMVVERYSKVMHIVSEVKGVLKDLCFAKDAIRSSFPAGTVSGAPKIQAIKTISALEKIPRGFYAGLVGYFGNNGNFDSCITIRSAVKKDNTLYLQAGGGVVYDSNPERELEETKEKMRAMAAAVGVEI